MQGFCPNCNANLNEKENYILTKESAIFKGHNVYCMCKNCGYVMVYNKDRDLIFSLDRFKDDEDIIKEIQMLLTAVSDSEIEIVTKEEVVKELREKEEVEPVCTGNCASCSGCSSKQTITEDNIKEGDLLAVNMKTGAMSIVHQDQLDLINIDDYEFFELTKVIVERIVSYKIQRI